MHPDPNFLAHWWWWVEIHLGITPKAPPAYYNAWSGALSDIGEITLLGGLFMAWRHVNCHVKNCARLGKHPVEGTPFKVCRKHHPTIADGDLSKERIHRAHHEHKTREAGHRQDLLDAVQPPAVVAPVKPTPAPTKRTTPKKSTT